jgi:hypothetical protein
MWDENFARIVSSGNVRAAEQYVRASVFRQPLDITNDKRVSDHAHVYMSCVALHYGVAVYCS